MSGFEHAYVHPCIIGDQAHIIYPHGLKKHAPNTYQQLSDYFSKLGYKLKEDQRTDKKKNRLHSKRRSWSPVLLFTTALFFESSAQADVEIDINDQLALQQQDIELKLISGKSVLSDIRTQLNISPAFNIIDIPSLKQRSASVLFKVLKSRYDYQSNDPEHIIPDLRKLAEYYSNFPEVITLFNAVSHYPWRLKFDELHWTTLASGNMFSVEKAEIHFNTRSAAQLKLNDSCKDNPVCIASPADALLHELLHIQSIFNDENSFIRQGGMNTVLYPYQHERSIIKNERNLYRLMSQKDGIKRPSRFSHSGRIVKANCSTCIK